MKTIKTEACEGYEIRHEQYMRDTDGENLVMLCAYSPSGDYIGNVDQARYFVTEKGIAPEKRLPEHKVCSIGFCEREQKWYGWSHRAIFGFGIGSVAKDGDCCTTVGVTKEYLAQHPEADITVPVGFVAKTLDDARRMACAFAESVG